MPATDLSIALMAPAVASLSLVGLTAALARRARSLAPPIGRFVDLPAARLHVLERSPEAVGTAPTLLLLHGLGGQLRHFSYRLIDELARSYRVIAFDRPGSGYSTWRAGVQPCLAAQADLVDALAAHLGLGRVVLVGHSLGGAIALGTALRHRERVAGLALLAPLTRAPVPVSRGFVEALRRADGIWRLMTWTVAVPVARLRRASWLSRIFAPDPVPPDFESLGGGALALRPAHILAAARDLIDIPDWLDTIAPLYPALQEARGLPIEVLFGRQDRVLSAHVQGESFASEVARARLHRIDAGHMLPLTRPQECAELIHRVVDATRG